MKISKKNAKLLFEKYKINKAIVPFDEWVNGLNIELEHGTMLDNDLSNITNNDPDLTARIVIAHLLENPRYYYYLKKMEKIMDDNSNKSKKKKSTIFLI